MAKFMPGPAIGVISGAQGNTVFSRNRYGAYMRTRVMPTLVQNEFTVAVRNRMATTSQAYGALSDDDKKAWMTWALVNPVVDSLGQQMVLQPSAAFIQLNMRILQAGGTLISVPPIATPPLNIDTITLVADVGAGDVDIAWTSGALGANEVLALWCSLIDNPGRAYYRNFLKLAHISAAAATTPEVFEPSLTARFGSPQVGARLFVEYQVWSDLTGLVSGRGYASVLVTTT